MKRPPLRFFFAAILAALCVARAFAQEAVDLSGQFPPNERPNQGSLGTCHDFSAAALIEAAYYRRYRPKRLDLAAQDVFVCCTGTCSMTEYKAVNGTTQCRLNESGHPFDDAQYVIDHGALPAGSCRSYAGFASRLYAVQERLEAQGLQQIQDSRSEPPVSTLPSLPQAQAAAAAPLAGCDGTQPAVKATSRQRT